MQYINLPEAHEVRSLSFYLAMEEFVARYVDADDCFFMWQVEPSVIFWLIVRSTTYRFIVARVGEAVCMPTATM